MRSKTQKYVPGEEIIFDIRPTFVVLAAQISPIILAVAGILYLFYYAGYASVWLTIGVVLAGTIAAFGMFLNWYYTSYRLTTRRVENRYGIIGSREEEISLDDIEAVDVETTPIGAVLNFGTVIIKAAGERREVDFVNISSPKRVANRIEDMSIDQQPHGGNE